MSTKDISDLQVLEACRDWPLHRHFADTLLAVRTTQHPRVAFRALERAHARGLIEWGVSIRTAWPTPEGRAMLEHAGLPATGVPPQLTPDADDCIGLRVLCQVGTEIRSAFYQPVRQHLWRDADRDQLKLVLQVDLRILLEQDQLQVLAFEPYTIGPPAPTV